jgi:tripartite-type tricarboxylate transporter receptor subunit TctC
MSIANSIVVLACTLLAMFGGGVTNAQTYPERPIRILCSGSTQELYTRAIADGITKPLGQPVIADNRASVPVASEAVARAKPDGYTILLAGGSFHLTPLTQKTAYDPVKDFNMITIVGRAPLVLYVSRFLPVKSVKELVALAKARPGELNSTIGGVGGGAHLALEQLNTLAGVKIVPVPYTAGSQELTDLISGRVEMTFAPPSPLMEQVKLGKLHALGVTSTTPSALAPGLPPIASTVPGLERVNMTIMAAPAGTPRPIVERLNREIVRVLNTADVKERLLAAGIEIDANSPEQASAMLAADVAKLSAIIKTMGLQIK